VPRANRLPACTDSGNAELFAALYKSRLLYDHRRSRWFVWREHWWMEDTDGEVQRLARSAARLRLRNAAELPDEDDRAKQARWALQSESRYRLQAALKLAESERLLACDGSGWDSDPWRFGVANGVLDLQTGTLSPGTPSDRMMRHTTALYDALAQCPRWIQFLKEIFLGDTELFEFVQRAVGYSLTGHTGEQCLFLCHGTGANGKSTFLETVRLVAGGYGWNLPFSAFELKARADISNDIASIVGKRLVTAVETNESVRLNEARVKALSGSDTISARFMYHEFFEFNPTAKIWLAFNHAPVVADDSPGFWRRIRLIPFPAQFTDGAADKQLGGKLLEELPGILAWAVRGCSAWQETGLGMPSVVKQATETYRHESNPIQEFIGDCCVVHPDAHVAAAVLWETFRDWTEANGERGQLDRKAFARRLEAQGFRKTRMGHSRTWTWLGICRQMDAEKQHIPVSAEVRSDEDVKIQ
jgi:putative DNA primase/helicase